MTAAGAVHWLDSEAQMPAATAIAGSGPAYLFALIEALTAAGEEAGLSRDLAARLATDTMAGAGILAQNSDKDAATLRADVTSPGGVTEAALTVLRRQDGLAELIRQTVQANLERNQQLG
jgi:pyrroline-5-carboxylate reductase